MTALRPSLNLHVQCMYMYNMYMYQWFLPPVISIHMYIHNAVNKLIINYIVFDYVMCSMNPYDIRDTCDVPPLCYDMSNVSKPLLKPFILLYVYTYMCTYTCTLYLYTYLCMCVCIHMYMFVLVLLCACIHVVLT